MTPEQKRELWSAINTHVSNCGGDPSKFRSGSWAVKTIHKIIEDIEHEIGITTMGIMDRANEQGR
jgi:hypothetical protein